MADQDLNANYSNANKSSSGSGSPWDEDLDILVDEPKKTTTVIGSLEPETPAEKEKTPVPFNVPEDIIEDKVGKKIPADQIIGKDVPKYYTPDQISESQENQKKSTDLGNNRLTINNVEPQEKQIPPVQTADNNNNSSTAGSEIKMNNEKNFVASPEMKEGGISELIKNDKPAKDNKVLSGQDDIEEILEDPFESPVIPSTPESRPTLNNTNNATARPNINVEDKIVSSDTRGTDENMISTIQNDEAMSVTVPAIPSNKGIDPLSKTNIPKPPAAESVIAKTDAEATITPQSNMESAVSAEPPAPQRKKFSLFKKKENKASKLQNTVSPKPASYPQPAIQNQNSAPPAQRQSQRPKRAPFRLPPSVSIVASILLICAAATYLTEIGLISIGFENVYGVFGVEKLWGGLPRSAETALGMAASNQKNHLSFKYSGKLTVTVDKTKKSPVTSPLVSYSHDVIPMTDFGMSLSEKALLSQSDGYEDYYGSSSSSSSNSSSSDSPSSVSSSTASDFEETDDIDTSDEDSPYGNTSNSNYVAEQTTVKQLDFEVSGKSNEESISSSVILKPLVGSNKQIELLNSYGDLYVKSDDIEFSDKAEKGKWLDYKLSKLSQENNNISEIFNISTDSGLSIMGRRIGNEKIGDTRCFKYKIDSFEIGDSLESIGIPQQAINSITGTVWIGVKDHLIHQISLTIVPSISAGLTNIQADIMFYDYDINNDITVPLLSNVIKITSDSNSNTSDQSTDTDTPTTPVVEIPSTDTTSNNTRTANDTKRDQDLNSIKAALIKYKNAYGKYPISYNFENISSSSSILKKSLVSGYISSMPNDPKSSEGWWYGYKSDGKTFTLSARFENINDTEVTKVGSVYLHYVKN